LLHTDALQWPLAEVTTNFQYKNKKYPNILEFGRKRNTSKL
jgi:hypothetical protein